MSNIFYKNPLLIFMDLEMTQDSKNKKVQQPLEIALVSTRGGEPYDLYQSLIQTPDNFISNKVKSLTGITPDLLHNAPSLEVVTESICDILVGLHLKEDRPILICTWGHEDEKWFKAMMKDSIYLMPFLKFYNIQHIAHLLQHSPLLLKSDLPVSMALANWIKYFDLEKDQEPHRAAPDARQTARVFLRLIQEWNLTMQSIIENS